MKISKLFHWLYAFLMFLPIFAVAVKCGYVMFNKNAQDSYRGEFDYSSSINLISVFNQSSTIFENVNVNNHSFYKYNNSLFYNFWYNPDWTYFTTNNNASHYLLFKVDYVKIGSFDTYDVGLMSIQHSESGRLIKLYSESNFSYIAGSWSNNFPYDSNGNQLVPFTSFYNSVDLTFNSVSSSIYGMTNSPYLTMIQGFGADIYYVDNTLSAVFYSALDELDSVQFFSWAKNSFLAEPFMYIGNLFGIPNVHPIFTFLSYWMAISVIWLVFDVFMYVPLLAHKWIDKGKVD